MALDIGFSSRGIERFFGAVPRSEPSVWGQFVQLLERSGDDWQQIQRIAVSDFWASPSLASAKLDQIEQDLTDHWSGKNSALEKMLVIPSASPSGFDVELFVDKVGIRGSFGGLAQDFTTVSGAMLWVRRGLSSAYQLRIVVIEGIPSEWRLEPAVRATGGVDTLAAGQAGILSVFKAKTIEYRQNALGRMPHATAC